ncbi:MAG: hypothetical protein NZ890_08505 [Myxococcota bacterium]|nr:hypothetical protein [Myxococcota bacterium]
MKKRFMEERITVIRLRALEAENVGCERRLAESLLDDEALEAPLGRKP